MNIAERGEYWARWRPQEVAIRARGVETTWAQLEDGVGRIAGGLRQRGIEPGDRVGILAANSVEFCQLALAVMHAGAVLVPLNIRLAPPELGLILEHSGCKAVGYDQALAGLYDGAVKPASGTPLTVSLDGIAEAEVAFTELAGAEPIACLPRGEHDVAVLGYTSGTTGLPKGVMLTHANIAAAALQTILAENSTGERRTLLCVPLAFTGGIVNTFLMTYAAGGMVVLEPGFVAERAIELIESERITTMFVVPVIWEAIAATSRFPNADLSSLSTAITGGAPVPEPLLRRFLDKGVAVRQAYGLTEATGSCCLLPAAMALAKTSAAGMPNVHTEIRLIGEDGAEVASGEVGEITIRGPQVMRGYWNDPEATADALHDGWLQTGDLGRHDADGLLEIVDRKKSMFISGGLNVYPAEIERVIDALPEVAESAAFGLAHERWGEACAVVVRGVGGPVDEDLVIGHCRSHLSDYKCPKTVFNTSDPLPRGMSGKIVRGELERLYATPA